ncbi:Uncharacterised protein [Phocoenobacter uteri]|uniref:Transmembrane protein n=1 Tax=Phocoenobacter uteri TaxID=146806 RepID=A0A379CDL3_9PAST|nr:hypothetical protein [Phocoenobacter uteri]MDG6881768.1 hypothetical protein [Phocoenobacter uteri]SUB59805.1 Uncharacterised protein [Phocoenobacter uteri]
MSKSTKQIKIENVSLQMEISDSKSQIQEEQSPCKWLAINKKNIDSYFVFLTMIVATNAIFLSNLPDNLVLLKASLHPLCYIALIVSCFIPIICSFFCFEQLARLKGDFDFEAIKFCIYYLTMGIFTFLILAIFVACTIYQCVNETEVSTQSMILIIISCIVVELILCKWLWKVIKNILNQKGNLK